MITGIGSGGGSSGGVFNSQRLEAMRQNRFKKLDADGDGKLTKDELAAGAPKNGKGPSVDEIFSKVDTNQDGVIDETEDKAAFESMRGSRGGRSQGPPPDAAKMAEALFKSTDSDGDGKITKSELTTALEKSNSASNSASKASDADTIFKAADTDGDGTITQAELAAYLEKARGHGHGHGHGHAGGDASASSSYAADMSARSTAVDAGSSLNAVA